MGAYAVGLDFGTGSVRALIVNVETGEEVGSGIYAYPSGVNGVLLDPDDPDVARQHPQDYLDGMEASVRQALAQATRRDDFDASRVIGLGTDATGSTVLPVDQDGSPLALDARFADRLEAMVWLWKDHASHDAAAAITERARAMRPHYLDWCGGSYSPEWFWSKVLHCLRTAPDIFEAAHTWVEHADWIPAVLTGTRDPAAYRRGICAAGHKGLYHEQWGGYPDDAFLSGLDERLLAIRRTLPDDVHTIEERAGTLCEQWAERLGLPAGIPVAVGAIDAHLGGVGAGIGPGTLVKVMGTSTCDMMVAPLEEKMPVIPGLAGIVPGSILPGYYGLEAGQAAVGDIFNWFVSGMRPDHHDHETLTAAAKRLQPGESGLLALDWHNGNRSVLTDQRLTGGLLGLTLHSTPAEIYRALIEATAFGARTIIERLEEYGMTVERIINCGGIAAKNDLVMQVYADVLDRPQYLSRSKQTPALGAAMAGAVVAGSSVGGHANFEQAIAHMTGVEEVVYEPDAERVATYDRLYSLYKRLHDAFGVPDESDDLADVMKVLLDVRDEARR